MAAKFEDILFFKAEGIAKIAINRPEVRNAFRPPTLFELLDAFERRTRGPSHRRDRSHRRGRSGVLLRAATREIRGDAGYVGPDGVPRLNVLDLQKQIRSLPEAGDRHGGRATRSAAATCCTSSAI